MIDNSATVWNSEWLNNKYKKIVDETSIIDNEKIENLEINFSKLETIQLGDYDKLFS